MKTNKFLIVLTAVFLAIIVFIIVKLDRAVDFTSKTHNTMQDNTLNIIFQRKSVRNFTDAAVSKEQLELLLRAGMAAPTARNMQPWAFVALTERSTLDSLAERLPYAKMLRQAQAAIVVCGDLEKLRALHRDYWIMDCSAATENILLAAEAMGLGAVWTAAYPQPDRVEAVTQILHLPASIIPLCVIPLGVPTGVDKPKDKYLPENIHWEKW